MKHIIILIHANQALFLEITEIIVLQGSSCYTARRPEADTGRKRKLDDSDDLSNPMASLTLHAIKKTKRFIEFTEDWKPIDPFKFASNGLSDVESTFSDESSSSGSYIELTEDWRPKDPSKFASNGLSDVESTFSDESSSSGSYIELTEDWWPKDPSKFASNGLSDVKLATADESSCSGDSSKVPSNNTVSAIEISDWNISAYEFDKKKPKKEQNREPTSP